METNQIRKRCLNSFISENNFENKITIVEKLFHELNESDYEMNKFNIVFSELAFSQALLPWENLYFYYGAQNIKKIAANKTEIKILPGRIKIYGIAVSFENLDKIRSPVNTCEGFKLNEFDKIILDASKNSDGFQEPHPLWEYPCKAISLKHEIFNFDFKKLNKSLTYEIEMPLIFDGLLNGIAIWQCIEYDADNYLNCGLLNEPTQDDYLKWSINYKQAVHLFDKKHVVNKETKNGLNLKCIVDFNIDVGKFNLDFKINKLKN